MNNNRPSDERVSTNLSARWDGLSGKHGGRIEDLSLREFLVNTTKRVDVGEFVGVELKPSGEWLQLRGEVGFDQRGVGLGVLFTFLTEEEKQSLRRLIS